MKVAPKGGTFMESENTPNCVAAAKVFVFPECLAKCESLGFYRAKPGNASFLRATNNRMPGRHLRALAEETFARADLLQEPPLWGKMHG